MNQPIKNYFDNHTEDYKKWKYGDKFENFIFSLEPGKRTLSLGCGAGREVKTLLAINHQVTAIDISGGMIRSSIITNPTAQHICIDAVDFARENKDILKFDYILGLFSFLNYIKLKDRRELIDNLYSMLDENGKIVFEFRKVDDRAQDFFKVLLSFFFRKTEEFGDIIEKEWTSHHYTENQIKKLFEGYNFELNGNWIKLIKFKQRKNE